MCEGLEQPLSDYHAKLLTSKSASGQRENSAPEPSPDPFPERITGKLPPQSDINNLIPKRGGTIDV